MNRGIKAGGKTENKDQCGKDQHFQLKGRVYQARKEKGKTQLYAAYKK